MLARKNRLVKSKDVKRLLSAKRPFFSSYFLLRRQTAASKEVVSSRFALVVSTKVSRSAVRRNRLKRLVRHEIIRLLPELILADYLLTVRPNAANLTATQLRTALGQALKQSGSFRVRAPLGLA